ncbi:hypothetical protein [Flavobacterium sp.]|jgi:hypothetical protein|uniref:DUF5963 family protein n=1 Tax=Flavobacterium sp. TaxID=239 RepID=UPI002CF5BE20|nr:hypothetical protein [Flavobacterium sp.]HQA75228.1 hypothetical protein [Flavobacterium sp.]
MKSNKIIGIILAVVALYLGYIGITKVSKSTKEVNVLGLEIDASNESGKEKGYLYLGAAVILFAGGMYSLKK